MHAKYQRDRINPSQKRGGCGVFGDASPFRMKEKLSKLRSTQDEFCLSVIRTTRSV